MKEKPYIIRLAVIISVIIPGILLIVFQVVPLINKTLIYSSESQNSQTADSQGTNAVQPVAGAKRTIQLPDEDKFILAAQSSKFRLWVDNETAHFKLESKQNGRIWRSYPDPEQWSKETITGTWKNNLLSPAMVEYIDLADFKAQSKIISWSEDNGQLENFKITGEGFRVTFHFSGTQFKIPVEVKLKDDYIETTIIDDSIQEVKLNLISLKLYPMFGAEPAYGQEGYLFLPDGSGALVRFKENLSNTNDSSVYLETVYGRDSAFYNESTSRNPVNMPVFGIKSANQAFVGVITEGEEYAKLFAASGGAFGQSYWVTPEWQYRVKYYQNTSNTNNTGFFTYNKKRFSVPKRSVRYYPLEESRSDYTGMAVKYREYLMNEKKLKVLRPKSDKTPFFVNIVGADVKRGLIWDHYLKGTSTSEAAQMIKSLYDMGIDNMTVIYSGWQKGGYSSYGGLFPVDSRLGGSTGMKEFIEFAHSLKIPVYLNSIYSQNNNGGDGFISRYHGLQDMGGTLLEQKNYSNGDIITQTSPRFEAKTILRDLKKYQELGADGINFDNGTGSLLNSDFNNRYKANRSEVKTLQEDVLRQVKQALGGVSAAKANFYALEQVNHIDRLADDYSYDWFEDEAVPFAQIVLHGLITYTSDWSNFREEFSTGFLKGIEYGAYPSYVFTDSASSDMFGAYSTNYYSMDYREWETKAYEEYKRYNQVFADLQDKMIMGHRRLVSGVAEITYEGGKIIVVNYNENPYSYGNIQVPGQDFISIEGGKKP
ncbi:hypothetical protein CLHUN_12000 [Ruminiclostridium hungatei]|uniref:Uncharacterized protein n=1 Tax=Ruminiclostridium hungatei TaxID=48256 RepID=A0A1V4SM67_RUMHU|nr:DUF5696 domain-containing protein [Ruminiclostridium hungatei]OPX44968.1 hypothetical protein CLHUN_12000 [Ruminiclostridium hungatei]